jgi:hypothetical protein
MPESLPITEPVRPEPPAPPRRRLRLLKICFAVFTFEVGLFLVIFPWRDTWTLNYFQGSFLENIWDEPAFRGAITGLGLVNIYLACVEFISAFRRQ